MRILTAFLRRDWAIARSYRLSFAVDAVGHFFALAVFYYLAKVVDRADLGSEAGLEQGYFAYAALGVILLDLASTGLVAFTYRLQYEQNTGSLEALLTTPASVGLVMIGTAMYAFLNAAIMAVAQLAMAIVLFDLRLRYSPTAVLTAVVGLAGSATLFAALGIVIAAFALVYKRSVGLLGLIRGALTLFGGVYFPIAALPPAFRGFAEALPFTWGLEVIRNALLGDHVALGRLTLLVVVATAAVPISLKVFGVALSNARRAGTLAHY